MKIGIIKWNRLGLKLRRLQKLMSNEIGNANQARMAAERANQTAPDGVILVTPVKAPSIAATISTVSATGGAGIGAVLAGIVTLLFPSLSVEQVGAIGTVAGMLATWVIALLRHQHENNNAPGAAS
jgi:hypothetical protein